MKINLAELDLSKYTTEQQALKVLEEYDEFIVEQTGRVKMEAVAEETFDLIQAVYGYLRKLNIDIEIANQKHMEKMRRRGK